MTDTTTAQAPFRFIQDWDKYDGMISWWNAKTLDRYTELSNMHPERHGWFCAFSKEQYAEGVAELISRGEIQGEQDIIQGKYGVFGTKQAINAMYDFYLDCATKIAEECNPQEVYCYEFNNHESMLAYDGDYEAFGKVVDLFGAEKAAKVKRFCAFYPLEHFVKGGER